MTASRGRRAAALALVVAGALVAVIAVFATWTQRQLLDQRAWEETSSSLIADPAIQHALADYIVDQVFEQVDLDRIQEALPPRLAPLVAPAAGALREPIDRAVRRALDAPRVQALWNAAASATHAQFVNLVEERGVALRLPNGGAVVLDLRPIVTEVGRRVGVPLTGERLPAGAGVIVVMSADQLDALQRAVKLLRALAIGLLLLAVALVAGGVWLARGRRRETLATAMLALVVAMIVVLLARRLVGEGVVGHLATTDTVQAAADAAWRIGTELLAQIARTTLVLALVLLLAAWLAGPGRLAERLRRLARPVLTGRPELVHGAVLAVLLALLALGVVPGIRTAVGAVLIVAVGIGGVELVRRRAVADRK